MTHSPTKRWTTWQILVIILLVITTIGVVASSCILSANYLPSIFPPSTNTPYKTRTVHPTKTRIPYPVITRIVTREPYTETFGLYKDFSFTSPRFWFLFETNRRPEPTNPVDMGDKPLGHDCADYQLVSPDDDSLIYVEMPCGFAEGFPVSCDPDTVIIKNISDKELVVRFPSQFHDLGYWEYTLGTIRSMIEGEEETLYCWDFSRKVFYRPNVRDYISRQDLLDLNNKDEILEADQVILSFIEDLYK